MPNITVLPLTNQKASAPGWAYVPTALAPDPSKIAIQPTAATRGARATRNQGPASSAEGLSARQRNEIAKRLAALDRESGGAREVPIPHRAGGKKASTPVVRKILASAKTFANHLADEEAALANAPPSTAAATTAILPRRTASTPVIAPPESPEHATPAEPPAQIFPAPLPPFSFPPPQPPPVRPPVVPPPDVMSELMDIPTIPQVSEEELEQLTKAPALSYNGARSAGTTKVQRHFCSMCGYWGQVKCRTCESRICGLECLMAHKESGGCRGM